MIASTIHESASCSHPSTVQINPEGLLAALHNPRSTRLPDPSNASQGKQHQRQPPRDRQPQTISLGPTRNSPWQGIHDTSKGIQKQLYPHHPNNIFGYNLVCTPEAPCPPPHQAPLIGPRHRNPFPTPHGSGRHESRPPLHVACLPPSYHVPPPSFPLTNSVMSMNLPLYPIFYNPPTNNTPNVSKARDTAWAMSECSATPCLSTRSSTPNRGKGSGEGDWPACDGRGDARWGNHHHSHHSHRYAPRGIIRWGTRHKW